MLLPADTIDDFRDGLARLRDDFDVPDEFPPEVLEAAEVAAARPLGPGRSEHVDRTDIEFLTLDPASSTDLDQAFAVEMAGSDVVLRYAIADVGWFVRPGDPIDREAWRRGVTVYLPNERAGLHPPRIAEDAGSLLPGGPKPAVVFVVRVAEDGGVRLDGVERAIVRNRAKLAYSTVTPADLPDAFPELSRRIEAAEVARGADRIQFPEQEVVHTDAGFALRFRPRNDAENQNAAMSLATNMAVADMLYAAQTGLFRTMPRVDERRLGRLRHTARAFGLDWPKGLSLAEFERSLPKGDARTSAFQLAVRRASGGASYEPYDPNERPWHAAVAATYSHATAPLRRLADRYVIEAALAVANGRAVPAEIEQAFTDLPEAMRDGDSRANRVERAAIDLAEAVVLEGRVGDVFDAVVTDEDDRGARIQVCEPAVVARVVARRVDPGDDVRVQLTEADPLTRTIRFERVG
ncbi:MAG: RNB domain-containing ribonuclease [Ilumatobacter sp.]|nr:RNB domain-containing ribonuclease [Ilumatobacter sp.]